MKMNYGETTLLDNRLHLNKTNAIRTIRNGAKMVNL